MSYSKETTDAMHKDILNQIENVAQKLDQHQKYNERRFNQLEQVTKDTLEQAKATNGRTTAIETWRTEAEPEIQKFQKHRWKVLGVLSFIAFAVPIIGLIIAFNT